MTRSSTLPSYNQEPLRLLYLADIRFPLERANGIQTMETCYALAARGHRVTLAVRPDTARPARDPFVFYGLPASSRLCVDQAVVWGPPPVRRVGYLAYALTRAIGRTHNDLVFTRDLGLASAVLSLPRALRPPVVHESHGFAPVFAETRHDLVSGARPAGWAKRTRLLRRERRVWREAEGYVTTTRGVAAELTARFGPRELVVTIPNGVRLPTDRRFVPPHPRSAPLVVYAGHLYPWKGVDLLLRALARLPATRGLIIGGHPREVDLPRARALADELGLTDRVTFTGLVDVARVPALLVEGDLLALPTTATPSASSYTSPLKMFEYLAAGKPIVASDLPAIREILRDGENAVLVEPDSAGALASAIDRLSKDHTLAGRIARTAFDQATTYGWDRRAERLEALMTAVVGK